MGAPLSFLYRGEIAKEVVGKRGGVIQRIGDRREQKRDKFSGWARS